MHFFHDGNDWCNLLCHVFFMHRVEMSWISVSPFPPKKNTYRKHMPRWKKKAVGPGEYWWSDHQLSWPCAGGNSGRSHCLDWTLVFHLRNLACNIFSPEIWQSHKKRLIANIDKKTWQSYKLGDPEDFPRFIFVGFFEWWRCGWLFFPHCLSFELAKRVWGKRQLSKFSIGMSDSWEHLQTWKDSW